MIDILKLSEIDLGELLLQRDEDAPDVSGDVLAIIKDVCARGDAALLEYTEKFDGVSLENLNVTAAELDAAMTKVESSFVQVLRQAAENIRAFHQKQLRQGFVMADKPGILMGQKITPLQRVGVYVPGGTAAYPSTVLMDVIPAQVANVDEIIMVTPPGEDGNVDPAILAAANLLGIRRVFKVGGAQAVAALAYGTKSIPRVDKIVGPGNIYVATAKKLVYGQVDIDMIAGPSDILVVADHSASAKYVAADMLGQSEHDKNAAAVLVTTSAELAGAVQKELEVQLKQLSRREIAEASLKKNGRILVADDLQQALETANAIAPEHLELCVEEPFSLLGMVRNAGSIFLGHHTPEALGDYLAGPNHTLPTAGTARFYSPLSVDDFIKKSSFLSYSRDELAKVSKSVQEFALHEGLDAHAKSVAIRDEYPKG